MDPWLIMPRLALFLGMRSPSFRVALSKVEPRDEHLDGALVGWCVPFSSSQVFFFHLVVIFPFSPPLDDQKGWKLGRALS